MANVEIYTKEVRSYRHRAKMLLSSRGVSSQGLLIDGNATKREEMTERSGCTMIPQTSTDAQHTDGCGNSYTLNTHGGPDPLPK